MHEDALFAIIPEQERPTMPARQHVKGDDIERIRDAFTSVGIVDQSRRKSIIESCVGREVTSLRSLYDSEVARVIRRILATQPTSSRATGSAWDNREEETWIDKL